MVNKINIVEIKEYSYFCDCCNNKKESYQLNKCELCDKDFCSKCKNNLINKIEWHYVCKNCKPKAKELIKLTLNLRETMKTYEKFKKKYFKTLKQLKNGYK